MNRSLMILAVMLVLVGLAVTKPVYDFKTSYVTQLTDFNFKDQVTKIRQNTNYVAIVQFYKYDGTLFIYLRRQVSRLRHQVRRVGHRVQWSLQNRSHRLRNLP